jgi:hypothetical protein
MPAFVVPTQSSLIKTHDALVLQSRVERTR